MAKILAQFSPQALATIAYNFKMQIYLDESYDQPAKRYLLLGMLFTPTGSLARRYEVIKRRYRSLVPGRDFLEVKYTTTSDA